MDKRSEQLLTKKKILKPKWDTSIYQLEWQTEQNETKQPLPRTNKVVEN